MKRILSHPMGWALALCLISLAGAFASARLIAAAMPGAALAGQGYDAVHDPARGRVLYVKSCARCHGSKAEGHGEDDDDGPNLHGLRISNARIATVARAGIHGHMPSFAKKHSREDISCIVAYLRTLP